MADNPPEALEIVGISRAAVAPDGSSVTLSLVDPDDGEYDISLTYERLGQTIVKLLGAAEIAGVQRETSDGAVATARAETQTLMPYPIVRYALGLSADGTQAALRLVAEDDLIWDFALPLQALAQLQDDIERLRSLPQAERPHNEE